ncbi:MAG: hypothetical protein ACO25F_03790 [Erythrobacter sp.]
MSRRFHLLLAGGAAALACASAAVLSQSVAAPPVRYTLDAETVSGLGGMAGGGMSGAMAMMQGRAPEASRRMVLRHGAGTAATQPAQADHFLPAGMKMGASLRLLPPQRTEGKPGEARYETPSGRLLLYWGCGERAQAGQPVVIDFSKLARGQVPPGLFAGPVNMPQDWEITSSNSKTYTDWPNRGELKPVPAGASLLGAHRISANYSREIAFDLAEDFMPPLEARSAAMPSGAYTLSWNGLAKATGYYAWAMGARDTGKGKPTEMVWWASSATQAFGGPLWDWISPAGVRKLIDAKTVLPPETRNCAIPAEVVKASGQGLMVNLQAYGPQVDFAYPPRPKDTRKPWNPEWIARVRLRSGTMLIPGMEGFGSADEGQAGETPPAEPELPKCKGLKGIAMRAAGLCR